MKTKKALIRRFSIATPLSQHPELSMRKEKIFSKANSKNKKTKIICTLGPSSNTIEKLLKMLDAGMNVARLNFLYGDHEYYSKITENLRAALRQRPEKTCAIMLDTKGPEIKTGLLEHSKSIELKKDQLLEITTDYACKGNYEKISCSYKLLPKSVEEGNEILIADGKLICKVLETKYDSIIVQCKNSASIYEKDSMNLPGIKIELPTLTEVDEENLIDFGLQEGIDMISASFIRKASDIEYIRDVLGPKGTHIKIIAKIENREGLENFEEILEAADGIMIARGDLALEIAVEKVFMAQKYMIDRSNRAGKPVITATQMLESMVINPRPTRAEATDVANAVIDGTDCLMLIEETATGNFPVEAVQIMAKLCAEAESVINYQNVFDLMVRFTPKPYTIQEAVCSTAVKTAYDIGARIIIVITETGAIARMVAKYRPRHMILALCVQFSVIRNLSLTWGIQTLRIASNIGTENIINDAIRYSVSKGYAEKGDQIVCLLGQNEETPENVNLMKIAICE